MQLVQQLLANVKNIPGWRAAEKFVVIAVDDYGNIGLNSAKARENLAAGGVQLKKHIDRLDALETRQDLEMLFETLSTVTGADGRSPVLTVNAVCANPDFQSINRGCGEYRYLPLPETFERLSDEQPMAYSGAWALWQEGISAGHFRPQFHGREHLNIRMFEKKLRANDSALILNLANHSMAGIGQEASMPGAKVTEAFAVWQKSELVGLRRIIASGLDLFEVVFGFRSETIVPPGLAFHPELYGYVEALGVKGIDKPGHCVRRLDKDQYIREWNWLGVNRGQEHASLIRNVVFEPTKIASTDSVSLAIQQIETAFRWRKPAIVSTHRVNFSGHIEAENGRNGLSALRRLLQEIVKRWPDVQFISADQLVNRMLVEKC